jgi:hypothetical protein
VTVELNSTSRLQSAMQNDVQELKVRILELEAIDRSGPFTQTRSMQLSQLRATVISWEREIQSVHNLGYSAMYIEQKNDTDD